MCIGLFFFWGGGVSDWELNIVSSDLAWRGDEVEGVHYISLPLVFVWCGGFY